MNILELFLIAIGLSMDAFAVSICKGLSKRKLETKNIFITGLYFGAFQAIMPAIGYFLCVWFESFITSVDHWIAFILLSIIGFNMIKEAYNGTENVDSSFSFKAMLPLAIATSIDALAVGITFAFLKTNILFAITIIGITTFVLSCIGVIVGNIFGSKYKNKAEVFGGIILIFIGIKILLEHLGIIG